MIVDADVNAANKDGLAATPSLRTLGTGAQQAAAGNDARLAAALYHGLGAPSAGVGIDGALYFNRTNGRMYGPKAAGASPGTRSPSPGPKDMAATRSAKYPHRWPNGTYHSIPYNQHQQNTGGGTVAIGNKPVTVGQWQSGALLNAMVPPGPAGANNPAAVTAGDIPTPGEVPLPPDPEYERQRGLAGQRRTNTLAGLTQQRSSGLTNYGFTETPGTGALAFDPNNPFSRASLFKKNYEHLSRAHGRADGERRPAVRGRVPDRPGHIEPRAGRRRGHAAEIARRVPERNTGARTQADTDYETGLSEINRAERALESPLYSPTADTPIAAAPKVVAPAAIKAPVSKAAITSSSRSRAGGVYSATRRSRRVSGSRGRC